MPSPRRRTDISRVFVRRGGASLQGHRDRLGGRLSFRFRSPFELHSQSGLSFMVVLRRDGSGPCCCRRRSNLATGELATRRFDCTGACLSAFGQGCHRWIILFSLSPSSSPSFTRSAPGRAPAFFLGLHVHRQLLVLLRRRSCLFRCDIVRDGAGPATWALAYPCLRGRTGRNDNAIPPVSLRLVPVACTSQYGFSSNMDGSRGSC